MKFSWRRFARDLRSHRKDRAETLREMAARAGVTVSVLHRAENGKPITVPNFLRLCRAIGVIAI